MNILVYAGNGTSPQSVAFTISTLKSILGHSHDVIQVDKKSILEDPWAETCSMIVIPGGRSLPYAQDLNGEGNKRIRKFVESGGRFLGIGAGGYYGSNFIEFEIGTPNEASHPCELGFYPGMCKGAVFSGFNYGSEKGARAAPLRFNGSFLPTLPGESRMYYNGGGWFVNAERLPQVHIFAWYKGESALNSQTPEKAAIVQASVGEGTVVLTGVHPEFIAAELDHSNPDYEGDILKALEEAEATRMDFLRALFARIGFDVGVV
ncbi:biotin-protein ligase [Endogone sp. FLAS-F59071]|nr:biotin-protein ligase [Endogone sp. FLAS-F59071]|eukprot:RUS22453.1 biotin-protein ligase [Endogone sp. FLAS-F59071]